MSPALRDALYRINSGGVPDYVTAILEELAELLTVRGVKVGGLYEHWKGKRYVVSDVVRDADAWEEHKVVYHEVTDATHRAERRVSSFLGDCDHGQGVTGPRFRLVG